MIKEKGTQVNFVRQAFGCFSEKFFIVRESTILRFFNALVQLDAECRGPEESGAASFPLKVGMATHQYKMNSIFSVVARLQDAVKTLLAERKRSNERVAALERRLGELGKENHALRAQCDRHEAQTLEYQTELERNRARNVELQRMFTSIVEVLRSESVESMPSDGFSAEGQELLLALNASLSTFQTRFDGERQDLLQRLVRTKIALRHIAMGTVPTLYSPHLSHISGLDGDIYSAAFTLTEMYSGIASLAQTIQGAVDVLFTMAEEIRSDAAQQMQVVRELQEIVGQIAHNSVTMAEQTSGTASIAQEMSGLGHSLMNEVDEMKSAVLESHQSIEGIRDIVEQSSLLALNARIIAAQANEHGNAFAVVADAMKDLSGQTHRFLQLITSRVQTITENTTKVQEGVRQMVTSMDSVQNHTRQIASGASEYNSATQTISGSVEKIVARSQHSADLAEKLTEMEKRMSIALQQFTEVVQSFDAQQGEELFDIYRSVSPTETAAPMKGIPSIERLREKRLAAIFTNKGPVDIVEEYGMHEEAERQNLRLTLYSAGNSARTGFKLAERLIADGIDLLFFQVSDNLSFQRILALAEKHQTIVIPFCRGGNVGNDRVPFQVLTQYYAEGKLAAECAPHHSVVYAILGPEHLHNANARARGFLDNLDPSTRCVRQSHGDWTATEAAILMKSFFQEHGQDACDVIYGINDTTVFGAIEACLEYVVTALIQTNALTWTAKITIGTDATEEMLSCIKDTDGNYVLGTMLRKCVLTLSHDDGEVDLIEGQGGWNLRWNRRHEAVFAVREGQISVTTDGKSVVIIKDMMTVSHGIFFDAEQKAVGVGAMALKHLAACVDAPGKPEYVLFSQDRAITRESPEEIVNAVRYAPTEQQLQWRRAHVFSLGPDDELMTVGAIDSQ